MSNELVHSLMIGRGWGVHTYTLNRFVLTMCFPIGYTLNGFLPNSNYSSAGNTQNGFEPYDENWARKKRGQTKYDETSN